MAAYCPKCGSAVPSSILKGAFSCPSCSVALSANTGGPWVAAIVLWILADIPVKYFLYDRFGFDSFGGVVARVVVSGLIGLGIIAFVLRQFSTINLTSTVFYPLRLANRLELI